MNKFYNSYTLSWCRCNSACRMYLLMCSIQTHYSVAYYELRKKSVKICISVLL